MHSSSLSSIMVPFSISDYRQPISKMQRVQNCYMRFMHGLRRRESIGRLYTLNNYLLLSVRWQWMMMLVLFYESVVKCGGPKYIAEEFKRQVNVHYHLTRNRPHRFIIPLPPTRAITSSFHFQAVHLWNKLPTNTYLGPQGQPVSVDTFWWRLRRHFLALDMQLWVFGHLTASRSCGHPAVGAMMRRDRMCACMYVCECECVPTLPPPTLSFLSHK